MLDTGSLKCHLKRDILIIQTVAPTKAHLCRCLDRCGTGLQASYKALCKPTTKRMDETDPLIVSARSPLPTALKKWHHKQFIKMLGVAMTSKVGEQVCNNSVKLGVLRNTVEVHWESRNTRGTMMGHCVKGSHHLCHSEWGDGHGQKLMLQPGVKLTRPKRTKDRSKMLTKILHRGEQGRGGTRSRAQKSCSWDT